MEKIDRPDKTFTIIYAHHGPFEYMEESEAFYRQTLSEMHRVLETGGVIRIVPARKDYLLENIISELGLDKKYGYKPRPISAVAA